MLDWISDRGWRLPERSYVQQYVQPHVTRADAPPAARDVEEVVFFGRLEPRKGVDVFCDAIDRLLDRRADFSVTFLGSASRFGDRPAGDYMRRPRRC